ncbi:MAG: choice-of-anchor D domain-containing protein, partial [Alphaproteobacteria bacterium]|nr:choice-of-anchor D domain-containing protein [Alphaproteobacteria bacterium]
MSSTESLHITAWEADPDNGLDGFTAGSPMSFKVYASVYDNMIEISPDVTWRVGDQNFGTGQFSVVELHAISGVDPVIRLDQASLAFPPVVTGQTWVDTLNIYNDGLSELSISSASTGTGFFSVGQDTFTILPESFFALPVSFAPSAAIPYTDVLTIASDDPDSPTKTVALQGQGLPVTAGVLSVPGAVIEFPATAMGDTSTVTVPLFNAGTQDLVVDSVVLGNNVFSVSVNNLVIGVGTTYSLPLSFSPDSVGGYQSTVLFYADSQLSPAVSR